MKIVILVVLVLVSLNLAACPASVLDGSYDSLKRPDLSIVIVIAIVLAASMKMSGTFRIRTFSFITSCQIVDETLA